MSEGIQLFYPVIFYEELDIAIDLKQSDQIRMEKMQNWIYMHHKNPTLTGKLYGQKILFLRWCLKWCLNPRLRAHLIWLVQDTFMQKNLKYSPISDTTHLLNLTNITHLICQHWGHNKTTSSSPLSSKGDQNNSNAYLSIIIFMIYHTTFQKK